MSMTFVMGGLGIVEAMRFNLAQQGEGVFVPAPAEFVSPAGSRHPIDYGQQKPDRRYDGRFRCPNR